MKDYIAEILTYGNTEDRLFRIWQLLMFSKLGHSDHVIVNHGG